MDVKSVALFTDLDGTLFDSYRNVSEQNKLAIARFVEAGGSFGISTGRAPDNARTMLPGLMINSWSVVLNGAEAYHYEKKMATAQHCLPKEKMEKLIKWVLKELPEVNIQLCTDKQLLFLSRMDYGDEEFISTHQPMTEMNVDEALRFPWLKVLFCASRSVLVELHHYAEDEGFTTIMDSVYTNETYLEFLPRCVNKGSCLRALRGLPEMQGKVFIAIGDYTNDLELLQEADVAIAVQNALPEVKDIADHIVCSNNDHALAYVINSLIPNL